MKTLRESVRPIVIGTSRALTFALAVTPAVAMFGHVGDARLSNVAAGTLAHTRSAHARAPHAGPHASGTACASLEVRTLQSRSISPPSLTPRSISPRNITPTVIVAPAITYSQPTPRPLTVQTLQSRSITPQVPSSSGPNRTIIRRGNAFSDY